MLQSVDARSRLSETQCTVKRKSEVSLHAPLLLILLPKGQGRRQILFLAFPEPATKQCCQARTVYLCWPELFVGRVGKKQK